VAQIDVLTGRPTGTVDPRIFGSVTEHLGRCVHGGVFAEGSPGGFRADVLAAVRDLGVTNVRWPLGAGPGGEEPGRFGTGEFLAWCAVAGVEPVLGLNMDTGTLDEALAWVNTATAAVKATGLAAGTGTGTPTRSVSGTGAWAVGCTAGAPRPST
jgi:alpha-N-arabinofuranosidase